MSGTATPAGNEFIHGVIAGGADVNHVDIRGFSALMMATERGNAETVTFLIGRGARMDQQTVLDGVFHTPLFEATRKKAD